MPPQQTKYLTDLPPESPERSGSDMDSYFNALVKEAPFIDGNPPGSTLPADIPWFDPELAEKGRRFVESNFFIVLVMKMLSIFVGLANKPIAVLSYETYYPKGCAGPRYLSTTRALMSFFLSPTHDKDSHLFREAERVRKLHKLYARPLVPPPVPHPDLESKMPPHYKEIAELVRSDLEGIDTSLCPTEIKGWNPPLLFSQYETSFALFGGMSASVLFPEKLFGLKYDREGRDGYVHLWTTVGRMLGVQDRFNSGLCHNDQDLFRKMIQHLGLGTMKLIDENVIFMMEESTKMMREIVPFSVTTKAVLYLILEFGEVSCKGLWDSMEIRDRFSYYLSSSIVWVHANLWVARVGLNWVARRVYNRYIRETKRDNYR